MAIARHVCVVLVVICLVALEVGLFSTPAFQPTADVDFRWATLGLIGTVVLWGLGRKYPHRLFTIVMTVHATVLIPVGVDQLTRRHYDEPHVLLATLALCMGWIALSSRLPGGHKTIGQGLGALITACWLCSGAFQGPWLSAGIALVGAIGFLALSVRQQSASFYVAGAMAAFVAVPMTICGLLLEPDGGLGDLEEFLAIWGLSFLIVALGLFSWDFSRTIVSARLQQLSLRRTPDGSPTRTDEERRVDEAETNREDPELRRLLTSLERKDRE
jgi:hypothetical protein